jgi:hypothetical protein
MLNILEKYMKGRERERERERERAKLYNELHCIKVVYETILHRSLFIERKLVIKKP